MRNTLETRLGYFFALTLIAGVVMLELIGSRDLFRSGTMYRAQFDNIQELKKGDPVKMAGVEVGRVDAITLAKGKVEVAMKVYGDPVVKTDSKASIRFAGLLGQNFIALDFGGEESPKAAPGALLESKTAADLNSLMTKLEGVASGVEGLTKNFSGENFSNLLGPLTDFMKENNPRLSSILENMKTVSTQIAEGKGTVGKLIMEPELYETTLATMQKLDKATLEIGPLFADARMTLERARSVVEHVNSGQGTIGRLIKEDLLYTETTTAMTNLKEILQKINQGQGSAGKLVNDEALFNNAKLTLQKLEKATEGLEDQGPLSIFGLAVGSLF